MCRVFLSCPSVHCLHVSSISEQHLVFTLKISHKRSLGLKDYLIRSDSLWRKKTKFLAIVTIFHRETVVLVKIYCATELKAFRICSVLAATSIFEAL